MLQGNNELVTVLISPRRKHVDPDLLCYLVQQGARQRTSCFLKLGHTSEVLINHYHTQGIPAH